MPESLNDRSIQSMRVLFVTRENRADLRYGLGKSLELIIEQLAHSQIPSRYLCQIHTSNRNRQLLDGINRSIIALCKLIPNQGISVCLKNLVMGLTERLNMGRLAAKVAKSDGFTHIHAQDPIIAAGALFFKFGAKISIGVTQHGFGSYSYAIHEDGVPMPTRVMRMMRNWERRTLRRCSWVMTPSQSGLEQLARDLCEHPIPSHWAVVKHPAPRMKIVSKAHARSELGLADDIFYILAVGRLVPLKDFETLIRATSQIETRRNWAIIILGDGDGTHLEDLAVQCGLKESQLKILATDHMSLWYSAVDMYVSSSLTESFGMANHEAVCAGVPSILTAVGAVAEIDGGGSLLVPKQQTDVMTLAIQRLINDPVLCAELSATGLAWHSKWPSLVEIADQYCDCYLKSSDRSGMIKPQS